MLKFEWIATLEDAGKTAGTVLRERFSCSASMVKAIRLHGQLLINGLHSRMKSRLCVGDRIFAGLDSVTVEDLHFPEDQKPIWQNDWLIAMSKKPGQTVHPSLNRELEDLCTLISDVPLHPVNRLDRDTSGIVLIALNGHSHYFLTQDHMIKKYYAFIHGRFPALSGRVSCSIGRAEDSLILRVPDPHGKEAVTLWHELAYCPLPSCSFVEFTLLTGRTHQIRLHSLWMGRPLVGESLYGLDTSLKAQDIQVRMESRDSFKNLNQSPEQKELDEMINRQALHAGYTEFTDPKSEKRIALRDPLPSDMLVIKQRLFTDLPEDLF